MNKSRLHVILVIGFVVLNGIIIGCSSNIEKDKQAITTLHDISDADIAQYINLADANIANISEFIDPLKIKAMTVDLDSWGHVNIVAVVIDAGKLYPAAYLTNEYGDVLYYIGAWQVGFEVFDVNVKDINGDGLIDIGIVTHFPFTEDSGDRMHLEWIYLQTEVETFYLYESQTDT